VTPTTDHSQALPLAISLGDPAGIGPEIIIKALLARPDLLDKCRLFGPRAWLLQQLDRYASSAPIEKGHSQYQARTQVLDNEIQGNEILGNPVQGKPALRKQDDAFQSLREAFAGQLIEDIVLPTQVRTDRDPDRVVDQIQIGKLSSIAGEYAFQSIVAATRAVLMGRARALVTAPIHKEAMHLAGHLYPGHTELLAELAGGVPVRMMLANPELRTVLVTIHMSLRKALDAITENAILETLKITDASLRRFGIGHERPERAPSLAVAGLNPHAGEAGLFGREEIDIIAPAIARARSLGIHAQGPFAPDTVFMKARGLQQFDAVIALYHDQGLIPVKYLGVEQGVNVTLGLPFVRTSPDHGTAFDIAGHGLADASSMLSAIDMADQLSERLTQSESL
jgi:4-hydroxythreonine-4-phosphate dehydrogenase